MCGICGKIYRDRERPVERDTLVAMCDAIHARGPDDRGYYLKGAVGLGSTRLSIIDVASGHMPLANEDQSVWVVYNGELYNFQSLRTRLERAGHHFKTHSDTETIVHLYEEVGDDFVHHLNGMFALAIWDERRQRLVLARDQLGIKPLYYAQLADRLLFGSELKALLPDGIDRSVDPVALHDYLSLNYVPGPRSMLSKVQKLPPGHLLTYEAGTGQVTVRQYWDVPRPLNGAAGGSIGNTAHLEDELLDLLRDVVRDQMISDVPLGAFLSGGLDSSVVVALMSEVSPQRVRTFSVGFEDRSYSELPYARIVADRFGTSHHEWVLRPRAEDLVGAAVEYFDEPFADSSSLAMSAVSKLAREHVKVVLSGDGGDEVFGGYYTYQADRLAAWYRRMPYAIGGRFVPWLVNKLPISSRKQSLDFKLRRFAAGGSLAPLPAHFAWKAYFSEEMKSQLYAHTASTATINGTRTPLRPSVTVLQEHFDRYATGDPMNRLIYVDTKVQLPDDMLTKVDRMSMAQSLEVRVPLLDRRLVEFMARLPSDLKVRGMTLKYLFKRVAARLLPSQILLRKKAGFHVPIGDWLKHDLRDMLHDYLSPATVAAQGFFHPPEVSRMIEAHERGIADYSRNLWNLLMLSRWHERYAGSATPVTTSGSTLNSLEHSAQPSCSL